MVARLGHAGQLSRPAGALHAGRPPALGLAAGARPPARPAPAPLAWESCASRAMHRAPLIRDLLADGRESFSFEFMPPKTEADERQLWRAIRSWSRCTPRSSR